MHLSSWFDQIGDDVWPFKIDALQLVNQYQERTGQEQLKQQQQEQQQQQLLEQEDKPPTIIIHSVLKKSDKPASKE